MSLPNWSAFVPEPGRKRVGLIGFSASSIHLAPWQDPRFELWGMNQSYIHFERRPDRWFEIHRPESRPDAAIPDYLDDLKVIGCPLYMIDREPQYPTSLAYPLKEVREAVPALYHRYFTSAAAYMTALAIVEGFEEIALYGIDCSTGTEYAAQKPCLEAWLSLAAGRGIKVTVPPQSSLFKSPFLYGFEPPRAFPQVLKASVPWLRDRINGYKAKNNELLEQIHQCEGAIAELESLLAFAESAGRGTQFPVAEGKA